MVTEMITNAVKGLQGDNTGLDLTHVGAVVKHFAAYAQVAVGRLAYIKISPRTLVDEILHFLQGFRLITLINRVR